MCFDLQIRLFVITAFLNKVNLKMLPRFNDND